MTTRPSPAGRIVVVGASLGGLRAAEQLRKQGWAGEIVVVGLEPHMPYNRPPLSKAVLLDPELAEEGAVARSTSLRVREDLNAEWRLGQPVTAARLADRMVRVGEHDWLEYDGLVVATGIRPRRLPFGGAEHRLVVRDMADALAARAALSSARSAVLVGGGFIGCEIASAARQLGCEVTVVEAGAEPMAAAIGEEVGSSLRTHHERSGVAFRTGAQIVDLVSAAGDHRISLSTGETMRADVVIEAVGSLPNVEWLEGSGLDLSDGVLCDDHMRVEGRADVVAVGDVARFPLPRFRATPRRVEHWGIPGDTAKIAAASLVAGLARAEPGPVVLDLVPGFWSDQFGLRLQAFGTPGEGETIRSLEGDLDAITSGGPALLGYYKDDHLVGVLGVGVPGPSIAKYRQALGMRTTAAAAVS